MALARVVPLWIVALRASRAISAPADDVSYRAGCDLSSVPISVRANS